MNANEAQAWLDRTLIPMQEVDRAELHVGNPDPERAAELREGLMHRQDTIDSVRRRLARGWRE